MHSQDGSTFGTSYKDSREVPCLLAELLLTCTEQALKDKAAGKDKGRILDQLESMLEKLPESEVQQVYALLDMPIDELRAKAGKSLSTAPLTHCTSC